MPNTPSLVNAGMTSVTPNAPVSSEDVAEVLTIFRCFGGGANCRADDPSGGGVSGSAPAYVFMFIEAMADAAVLGGMPRAQAINSPPAVMGSAKMVLESGEHPGAERYGFSAGTIEAVRVLEEKGFRSAVIGHHPAVWKIRETEPLKLSRRASSPERLKNGARAPFSGFLQAATMKVLRSSPFSDFAVAALLQSLIFCC